MVLASLDSGSSRAERNPRKKKRGESSLSLGIATIPFGGDSSDGTNRCEQVSLHEVSLLGQDRKEARGTSLSALPGEVIDAKHAHLSCWGDWNGL